MSTSSKQLDRIKELTGQLATKRKTIDEMTDSFAVEAGRVSLTTEQHAAYLQHVEDAKQIKSILDAETFMSGVRGWLDAPEGTPAAAEAAVKAAHGAQASFGQQLLASDAWGQFKAGGYRKNLNLDMENTSWWDNHAAKDVWSLSAGTFNRQGLGTAEQRPLVSKLNRRVHIRELFPPETTNASVLFSVRQTGFVNAAKPIRERAAADGTSAPVGNDTDSFGRAPKSKLTMETITYPIAEVKHVDYIHETVLEDEPRIRGLVNGQMQEGLHLAEDDQILFGDGAGANLRGIFNTAGIQTYNQPTVPGPPVSAAEKKTTTLRRAITRVQLAELNPTGIIVNPLDWEDMELESDSQGRLTLVTSIAIGAEERVWRLPVVPTTAMPELRYLLGAFGIGAQLYDRRASSIQVATENRDQFEQSVVTVKASERIALTVDRPEAFVTGTLVS